MKLEMLQVPSCVANAYDEWLYELEKAAEGNPVEKLHEAYDRLTEHLADDPVGRRLFGELDEAISARLWASEQAGFSLGFMMGRWPDRILNPDGAG